LGYNENDCQTNVLTNIINSTKYFEKVISNPYQREEFVEEIVKYAELQYYPKGSVVYYFGKNSYKLN